MCTFVDKEIPQFSKPVTLGKGNEALEDEIMEEIVNQHYFSIIKKVNDILEEVKQKEESQAEEAKVSKSHKEWKN